MSGHTTLKRDGGWTVELMNPVAGVEQLDIRPLNLEHTIRWARAEIPSVLALLEDLTGVKENILIQLNGPDIERVLMAFALMVPSSIKGDFDNGRRPLATPIEAMSDEQREEYVYNKLDQNDPEDPRFPKVDGLVRRYREPQQPVKQPSEQAAEQTADEAAIEEALKPSGPGVDTAPPSIMRKVG